MSERREGWYWVMVFEDSWEPAYFDGQHFTLDHGPIAKVGQHIPSPGEAPPIGTRYRNEAGEVVSVVVPIEASEEMAIAAAISDGEKDEDGTKEACFRWDYHEAITALPEPE